VHSDNIKNLQNNTWDYLFGVIRVNARMLFLPSMAVMSLIIMRELGFVEFMQVKNSNEITNSHTFNSISRGDW
jgi:hypothetical protein